jgi:hypothetical protein
MKNKMKKLIILLTIFMTTTIFSQKLEFKKGKIYLDNNKLSNSEIKNYLNTNYEAKDLYEKAVTKKAVGHVLLGLGLGLTVTDAILGSTKYGYKYPKATTFIGLSAIAISIPVLSGINKLLKKSVSTYNSGIEKKSNSSSFEYDINIVSNSNGYGIKISF